MKVFTPKKRRYMIVDPYGSVKLVVETLSHARQECGPHYRIFEYVRGREVKP